MSRQTRVYIGKLPDRTTERDVERFLKSYGKIREVVNKGTYMFVEFDDYRDAADAVADSGRDLNGERVYVQWASRRERSPRGPSRAVRGEGRGSGRFPPPRNTKWRVVIRNLSMRATWADVKDFMRQEAEVTFAEAHRRRRGEGIADFASKTDMKRAIERLDGRELKGERVQLVEEETGAGRRSSSVSSRGRSRSRSRQRDNERERRSRSTRSRSRERTKPAAEREAPVPRTRDDRNARAASRSRSRSPQRSRTGGGAAEREEPRSREPREGRLNSERERERERERDRDRL